MKETMLTRAAQRVKPTLARVGRWLKSEGARPYCLLAVFVFALLPLLSLVFHITGADLSFVLHDPNFFKAVKNSLLYSLIASALTVLFALLAAYLLNRSSFRYKDVFAALLTLGMLVPTLSIGLGVRTLFGKRGLLDLLFGLSIEITGMPGLVLGSVVAAFPAAFLLLYDALRYEDKRPYDAASIMGISHGSAFLRLTLPYLRLALISAFFASFALIFSDYGVPMEVAGRIKTLPMYLYEQVLSTYNYGRGSIAGLLLLLPALLSFLFDLIFKADRGTEKSPRLLQRGRGFHITAAIILSLLSLLLFLPQLSFISLSFFERYPTDLSFSLKHFAEIFSGGYGTGAGIASYIVNSLLMALLTAVIGTAFAYLLGLMSARKEGPLGRVLHLFAVSSLAIPGLVLGIGYIFLFKGTAGFFYGTVAILVCVNVFHFLGSPYLLARNCLEKIDRDYEVTGLSLGIGRGRILQKVLIPLSLSTLLEMFSYYFINAMITISAVSFLFSFGNMPLAVLINTYEKAGNYEMQAVISVVILAINLPIKLLLSLLRRKLAHKKSKEDSAMALSRFQFDLMVYLDEHGTRVYSQRYLSDELTVSVGTVNKTLRELTAEGLIAQSERGELSITQKGYAALEPYRVHKAIILASGFGSRLAPVTLDTPKPLVKVNGVRIIDTLLDALVAKGITNIILVRGYLKEQFDVLKEKYPNITFINNELFNVTNNISSLVKAVDYIDRCYICEADLFLSNPDVIRKYEYASSYLCAKVKETDDWCFDKVGGYIAKFRQGGEDCYQMYGISFWSEEDSVKLRDALIKTYNSRAGKEKFWDAAPLVNFKKDFRIELHLCQKQDITEIDAFHELVAIDPSYADYPGHEKY